MVKLALKILALGGSLFVGGSTLLSSKLPAVRKMSSSREEKDQIKTVLSSEANPCIIYEAEEPIWWKWRRAFLKLKRRFDSQDEFFKELEGKSDVRKVEELKEKIRNRCSQKVNVYLYYKENDWVYAPDMNEGGYDWVKAGRIQRESGDVIKYE